MNALADEITPLVSALHRLDGAEVVHVAPLVDPTYAAVGLLESDAMAIDDAALHQGYLRGFARRGGKLTTDAEALKVTPTAGGGWWVETRVGGIEAGVLVNAAGAWAEDIAGLAGVAPIGLEPKRRTAILLDPPEVNGVPVGTWPMVTDVDDEFYVKPEGAALMVSPADETPSTPTDAQPEELDVAIAVDRYEMLTGQTVRTVHRRWAGLRTFMPDHSPAIGFDVEAPSFFWLAGQGGFGFMTAPGAARLAAALILGREPEEGLLPIIPEVAPVRR